MWRYAIKNKAVARAPEYARERSSCPTLFTRAGSSAKQSSFNANALSSHEPSSSSRALPPLSFFVCAPAREKIYINAARESRRALKGLESPPPPSARVARDNIFSRLRTRCPASLPRSHLKVRVRCVESKGLCNHILFSVMHKTLPSTHARPLAKVHFH